jgi:arginyl-tRNA synthetase
MENTKSYIQQAIKRVCQDLFGIDVEPALTRPDEQFGDYATNIALHLSKQLGKNPREIAEALAENIKGKSTQIQEATVAGPGFLNLKLTNKALAELAESTPSKSLEGQSIVFEYSDPNPFKVLHAGHLYQTVVGDAIANVLEVAGATVHRVNFGGDVGLHVGKTMWAILKALGGEHPEKLADISVAQRSEWLSQRYIEGSNAYEDSETAKQAIVELNKRVYQVHTDNDHDSPFASIYWTTRQWSYDYFDSFYASIGSGFEKYYPESQTAPLGLKTVLEQLEKGVYEKSDGAVVFKGEPYGLHTRVFINSNGLPTYEAKDVGLTMTKWEDYHFDRTIIITGNDITEYMKVVLKSIEQFAPDLAERTTHLTHGQVKLAGGVKMSSRKGNILRAQDVLNTAQEANKNINGTEQPDVVLGAVKYAFVKQSIGPDIIYNPEESVAIQGNSGPYLQYAHARARSVLAKSGLPEGRSLQDLQDLQEGERTLLRKVGEYAETVERVVEELMPHHICSYLYDLAQVFNRFYEHNRVIGDPRQDTRLQLVQAYADTLKKGLELLNIPAPERM